VRLWLTLAADDPDDGHGDHRGTGLLLSGGGYQVGTRIPATPKIR
jgi:hypothetical protein